MHRNEVYPMINSNNAYPGYPKSFNSPPKYYYNGVDGSVDANGNQIIPQCGGYNADTNMWDTLPNTSLANETLFNNLDETTQIDLATLFVDGDPDDQPAATENTDPEQGEETVVVTPSDMVYTDMTVDDICVVDFDLKWVESKHEPSRETGMHMTYYKHRKDVNAVIHTHQPAVSALSLVNAPIPALFDEVWNPEQHVWERTKKPPP